MEGTVLQDMLWGVWACLTRAVRCGRQPQAIQVGTQSAVPSAQPEDHNPLVTRKGMYCVTWIVVLQFFGAALYVSLYERFGLPVRYSVVLLPECAAVLCQPVGLLIPIHAAVSRDPLYSNFDPL